MTNGADCCAEQVLPDQTGKHQPDKEADQRRGGVAEEVRGDEDFAQAFFREGAEYQGGQGDADDEAPQRGQPFEGEDTGARSGVTIKIGMSEVTMLSMMMVGWWMWHAFYVFLKRLAQRRPSARGIKPGFAASGIASPDDVSVCRFCVSRRQCLPRGGADRQD